MEPPLCVVSSWVIKRVYIILIWNTISGSSNLDNCFYHCLIFTLMLHLKVLFNSSSSSSSYYYYYYYYYYIVILYMVRPRSYRVIYYFDTPALEIRYQSFERVKEQALEACRVRCHNIEGGSLHKGIYLPTSIRPSERMTFQCNLFCFHNNMFNKFWKNNFI